jgi:hypothetical protein
VGPSIEFPLRTGVRTLRDLSFFEGMYSMNTRVMGLVVLFGGAPWATAQQPLHFIIGDREFDYLGYSAERTPDMNQDGVPDLIVGSPFLPLVGTVFWVTPVWIGSPSRWRASETWTRTVTATSSSAPARARMSATPTLFSGKTGNKLYEWFGEVDKELLGFSHHSLLQRAAGGRR